MTSFFKQKTPDQRIREEMSKALDYYGSTDSLKNEFTAIALQIDTVTTMNIPVLAAVMLHLHNRNIKEEIAVDDVSDKALNVYLNHLIEEFGGSEDRNVLRYRYRQTFLRYMAKVISSR